MLFFFNKKIIKNKRIINTLILIYGINQKTAINICLSIGINPNAKFNQLPNQKINLLKYFINKFIITEKNLIEKQYNIFKKLIKIKTYKGIRYTFGLPLNGQRTHTNRKTARKLQLKWLK